MAMYEWAELIKLWHLEQVDTEQTIGQLLQRGEQSHAALATVQRRLDAQEQALAMLTARVAVLETRR
jgi:hypothetical protein